MRGRFWEPPSGPDIEMQPAGVWWDAVRVPVGIGEVALNGLGEKGGAVIKDPWGHRVYWLVPVGSADGWVLEQVRVLQATCYLAVPPPGRVGSCGPHWLLPPASDRHHLTDAGLLHHALGVAVAAEIGPRPRQSASPGDGAPGNGAPSPG